MNVLVTGGCGYIGAHTIVDLIENGYENIICVDSLINANETLLKGIEEITGRKIENLPIDLCNYDQIKEVFIHNKIDSIIHFAALKSVPESVSNPFLYYKNNLNSLNNLLELSKEFAVKQFIFSSSCSIYGNIEELPVTENSQLGEPQSPYAASKLMGEMMIKDFAKNAACTFILLRYFNPVGAHKRALIGEIPKGRPQTIIPSITQAVAGVLPSISVFGTDYDTRDGSCIRDFIHVSDIAHAHTLAIEYALSKQGTSNYEIFNLGTGNGVSILEVIKTFEKVNNVKVPVIYGERRAGDVVSIYADNKKARNVLKWEEKYSLDQMLSSAWKWQQNLLKK
jgi:UDP-glucose 4-epimerase